MASSPTQLPEGAVSHIWPSCLPSDLSNKHDQPVVLPNSEVSYGPISPRTHQIIGPCLHPLQMWILASSGVHLGSTAWLSSFQKSKTKFWGSKRKETCHIQVSPSKMISGFLNRNLTGQEKVEWYIQIPGETCQPRILTWKSCPS